MTTTPSSAPPTTALRPRPPAPGHSGAARPGGAPTVEPTQTSARRLAGRYRYDRRSGTWWWSPEMYGLFRLGPSPAEPGTELLVRHQHPDDRGRTLDALTGACTEGRPFSLQVRVADGDGGLRPVVLLGEPELDGNGAVSAVEGVAVEVPPEPARPPRHEDSDRVRALETEVGQLRTAMASRAAIEQAKGILMLLTSCGDQVAFDLLAHISSHTHRKVRDVATAITASATGRCPLPDDVQSIIRDVCPPARPMH